MTDAPIATRNKMNSSNPLTKFTGKKIKKWFQKNKGTSSINISPQIKSLIFQPLQILDFNQSSF